MHRDNVAKDISMTEDEECGILGRRQFLHAAGLLTGGAALQQGKRLDAATRSATANRSSFPRGFLWGASTAAYQVEGNNSNSDMWLLEHVKPSAFAEPSGDADNSFMLWEEDLDLVKRIGLNSYRFSLEWARIEPEQGFISIAMLDHYKRIIAACKARGLAPVVTFNHFSNPRWFAALGGWVNPNASTLFARYCGIAARHLAPDIAYAVTLNEPNLPSHLAWVRLPASVYDAARANREAAARSMGVASYNAGFMFTAQDYAVMIPNLIAAHVRARDAIKTVRPDLPVGLSLSVADDQALGQESLIEKKREESYGPWLRAAEKDDFVGVQNYARTVIDRNGIVKPAPGVPLTDMGTEIYPTSLAGSVKYIHQATKKPIFVTEHGIGTNDDTVRARFITDALAGLKSVIDTGVPVIGYLHWSLLDNYEWYSGYRPKFGLASVDRKTFKRTLKPSASVLGKIAGSNTLR